MSYASLRDLLIDALADTYDADRQLLAAFPRLAAAADAATLQRFCREGVEYTERRIERLDAAFHALHVTPQGAPSRAMKGLIDAALAVAARTAPAAVKDAALLAAIQKLSHHGHASYCSICGFAEALGESRAAELLRLSLAEKSEAIDEMTAMARDEIDPRARAAGG